MATFKLKSVEKETYLYWYEVEAKNFKEAKERLESGDGKYIDSELVESETLSVEEVK